MDKQIKDIRPIRQVYFRGSKRYEKVQPKYELLTTNCGRRSLVVNAIFLGIAPEVIMKCTSSTYDKKKLPTTISARQPNK